MDSNVDWQTAAGNLMDGQAPVVRDAWDRFVLGFETEHGTMPAPAMYAAAAAYVAAVYLMSADEHAEPDPTEPVEASRDNLYPQGYGVFQDGRDGRAIEGKVYSPAHVEVRLARWRALEVIQTLASQLLYRDQHEMTVSFFGRYVETPRE